MRVFTTKAQAGAELADLVRNAVQGPVLVLGVAPHGLPVADPVAAALGVSAHPVTVTQHPDGLQVQALPELGENTVVVVDDGVETGSAARAIAGALRASGSMRIVLAVPVCPREALATLQLAYDEVIAIDTPLARRSLRWHYADWHEQA